MLTLRRLGLGLGRLGGGVDAIAPVFTDVAIASSVFSATASEACTGYYVWTTTTTPVVGTTAKASALAASPAQTIAIIIGTNNGAINGEPTASGTYYLHIVGQDAAGNLGALTVASNAYVVTDITAPVLTSLALTTTQPNPTVSGSLSEAATMYYVWTTTVTAIATATIQTNALAASPPQTLAWVTGANSTITTGAPTTPGTYYLHIFPKDPSNNSGVETVSAGYVVTAAQWDLDRTTFSSTVFAVGTQDTQPSGVIVKADGLKLWISGDNGNEIDEYSMSTAWDITTLTFVSVLAIGATDTNISAVAMSSDGTKIFALGNQLDNVYMFALPTAYLLSSASATPTATFAVGGQDITMTGLTFSDDGLFMYTCGSTGDNVYQYTLTVAFDITTASFTRSFGVNTKEGAVASVTFGNSGTIMYICGSSSTSIHAYNLSTAWNISTAVFSKSKSISTETALPTGMFWKPTGDVLFVSDDTNNRILKYTVA